MRCFEVLTREQIEKLFSDFYSLDSKEQQDAYIAGCIQAHIVQRRRPRKVPEVQDNNGNDANSGEDDNNTLPSKSANMYFHDKSFSYKVHIQQDNAIVEVPICQNAFLAIHAVTKGRLRTVQHALKLNQYSPRDMRGKHSNRPTAMPKPLITLIEYQINSFKSRQSYYSCRDNPKKFYLPEDLSVKSMHKMFLVEYQIQVPYRSYWKIFDTFNISFGYPHSDELTAE